MKYAVYTKWYWPEGVIGSIELSDHMKKNVPNDHPFDDILWWQIDEHHHPKMESRPFDFSITKNVLLYGLMIIGS